MLRTYTPLKRTTRLRPVSAKRSREAKVYARKRAQFLIDHPLCMVWLEINGVAEADAKFRGGILEDGTRVPLSTEVHHKAGRYGGNYLDESTWLAVCRASHELIHRNPKEARARGWLV